MEGHPPLHTLMKGKQQATRRESPSTRSLKKQLNQIYTSVHEVQTNPPERQLYRGVEHFTYMWHHRGMKQSSRSDITVFT